MSPGERLINFGITLGSLTEQAFVNYLVEKCGVNKLHIGMALEALLQIYTDMQNHKEQQN